MTPGAVSETATVPGSHLSREFSPHSAPPRLQISSGALRGRRPESVSTLSRRPVASRFGAALRSLGPSRQHAPLAFEDDTEWSGPGARRWHSSELTARITAPTTSSLALTLPLLPATAGLGQALYSRQTSHRRTVNVASGFSNTSSDTDQRRPRKVPSHPELVSLPNASAPTGVERADRRDRTAGLPYGASRRTPHPPAARIATYDRRRMAGDGDVRETERLGARRLGRAEVERDASGWLRACRAPCGPLPERGEASTPSASASRRVSAPNIWTRPQLRGRVMGGLIRRGCSMNGEIGFGCPFWCSTCPGLNAPVTWPSLAREGRCDARRRFLDGRLPAAVVAAGEREL
ncbi:hypothetical protein BC628DRAFT_704140 [Trametes gibbosa]|nr:hypothetical protein BC628DRAFT_704140 [Trametes gibbosa]